MISLGRDASYALLDVCGVASRAVRDHVAVKGASLDTLLSPARGKR